VTRRNIATTLPRRRAGGMARFDRLPAPLRAWLHDAALPWSAVSVQRLWHRALAETGDPQTALARLDAAEARQLSRDRMAVPARTDA